MDVQQAIEARRSIRKYTGAPLDEKSIRELLEAARLAPSSVNSQPWRFKVITKREEIDWIASEGSKGQRWVSSAGAVFLCCVDTSAYVDDSRKMYKYLKDSGALVPDMVPNLEQMMERMNGLPQSTLRLASAINTAIAMTMMMLRAVDMGLGTCWMGMYDEEKMKEHFAIPQELDLVALLAAGHPEEAPDQRPRKSMDEIIIP